MVCFVCVMLCCRGVVRVCVCCVLFGVVLCCVVLCCGRLKFDVLFCLFVFGLVVVCFCGFV